MVSLAKGLGARAGQAMGFGSGVPLRIRKDTQETVSRRGAESQGRWMVAAVAIVVAVRHQAFAPSRLRANSFRPVASPTSAAIGLVLGVTTFQTLEADAGPNGSTGSTSGAEKLDFSKNHPQAPDNSTEHG